ncbi:hypothetical protein [Thermococcus sp. Bubb.Bath]|uniref:hypothetical protein n=1 Tax=Thermococcus sp. Bubb.Bath TaxID=1638242 RepID=UPI001F0F4C29|nr:hypothetical protein [Thermococcus sp. Bubb.Bath]
MDVRLLFWAKRRAHEGGRIHLKRRGRKSWHVISRTYKTPFSYSSFSESLSNPPENQVNKPDVYVFFKGQWTSGLESLNLTSTNFTEFKQLILTESQSPAVYNGILVLPDGKIGDLESPTIIVRAQFNKIHDVVTVVYPGAVLRGYTPQAPYKPTSLGDYSGSIQAITSKLASPGFSEIKLILGQPYAYYKLTNGTIKIETLDCNFEVMGENITGACRTR